MRQLISLTLFLSLTSSFFLRLTNFLIPDINLTKETAIQGEAKSPEDLERFVVAGPMLTINDPSVIEGNSGDAPDTLRYVVSRTDATTSFWVNYETRDSTAHLTENDYVRTNGRLYFPLSGDLTDTIKVPVIGDGKTELDEFVKVELSCIFGQSGPTMMVDSIGVGTIINNDTSYLIIRDTSVIEGDSGFDSLRFVVDLAGELDTAFQFFFNTMDSTAKAGSDYEGQPLVPRTGSGSGVGVYFPGLDTITVRVIGELKTELDEILKGIISNPSAGGRSIELRDSIGIGTIINDDTTRISISDASILEGYGGVDSIVFIVRADGLMDSLPIIYTTMDSTATVADNDYVPTTDTLYLDCVPTDTIKIAVIGNTLTELDEIFKVMLSTFGPNFGQIIIEDGIGLGTIINDDFEPTISDPCDCLNNASSNTAKDGQFSETVQVSSQSGEVWYISSISGFSQPPIGAFPPAKGGNPYPLYAFPTGSNGTKLTEIALGNGLSYYELNGIHVDDLGFELRVTNGVFTLEIGNRCHYERACRGDQTIVMPFYKHVAGDATIRNCTGENLFINDGKHLYLDDSIRYNKTTICPNITGQLLTVSFQSFDLPPGDTLWVFDGPDSTVNLIAKGSGNSISNFNGAWVTSNCDPSINASGCLTFALTTNGDNNKGAGWEAKVSCALQGFTTLNPPDDVFAAVNCDSLLTPVNLRMPTISRSSTECLLADDRIIYTYCNVRDTFNAGNLTYPVFPIGTYRVDYKLLVDTTVTTFNTVHVSAPTLTCNDTVITAIGQGCVTMLTPDDLLEDLCEATSSFVNQTYRISIRTDKGTFVGTGPDYPILDATKDGNVKCNAIYEATVYRMIESNKFGCSKQQVDSCTVRVKLIDGINPVFVNVEPDTIFGCHNMNLAVDGLPEPIVIDNCEIDRIEASIPPSSPLNCSNYNTIEVLWTAYDVCGNSSTATQSITIQRPDKMIIPSDTIVPCDANLSPDLLGWPKIDSKGDGIGNQTITDEINFCNFDLIYVDDTIPGTCGGSRNILRIFTLLDNCGAINNLLAIDTQYILIRDTVAPVFDCPAPGALGSATNPYQFKTDYNSCFGLPGIIEAPTGTDACGNNLTTTVTGVYRVSDNQLVASKLSNIAPLEVGSYQVAYQLSDDCGNDSEACYLYFNIADQTSPAAICSDELIVSLAYGDLLISAEDINNGSHDACGIDTVLVRRTLCGSETEYPEKINDFVADKFGYELDANGWSSHISIGCCDMNTNIKVQLLVFDKSGNHNKCWLIITPENQPQSVCGDLPDAIGYCDDYETSYIGQSTDANSNRVFDEDEWQPIDEELIDIINNQFGNPACNTTSTVCSSSSIEQQYQLLKETCGVQTMRRRFRNRGVDSTLYSWYYQNIRIDYRPGWSITFPADTILPCGTTDVGNIPEMTLQINKGTCDQLGWEVKDEIFETEDGSCYKILRQWYVINGCQHSNVQQPFELPRDQVNGKVNYNAKRTFTSSESVGSTALNTQGYLSYTQIIIVMDNEAPIITIGEVDTCIYGVADAPPFSQADITPGVAPFECDTLRLFSASAMDCTESDLLDFSYEIFDEGALASFGEGSFIYHIVQPNRDYRVRFTASDNCGNIGVTERTYRFRDCRNPSVICQDISLNLDAFQRAELTARQINGYSFDNCTDSSNIELRIWHPVLGIPVPTNVTEVLALPQSVILTCLFRGTTNANLYVVDESGNYGSCVADVTLTDNLNLCPAGPRPVISGRIQTAMGDMVDDVQVLVSGNGTMPDMITTDDSGTYSYALEAGADYTIQPKKDKNPLNGVSTFDLVLMQKHILGLQTFDSPYHYIAADVNQSGVVTAFDMVITRQLILSIITEFPKTESWKFVNMAYPMTAENPLIDGYHEYQEISNINTNMAVDFIAVKVGDVNGNAKPNALAVSEERSVNGTLDFHIQDQQIEAGKTYTFEFSAANISNIEGYQFTIDYNGLSFDNWESGIVDETHFGYKFAERGWITTSWNKKEATIFSSKASMFSLKFTAHQSGMLSEMLQINSEVTLAEAYRNNEELLDVALIFDQATTNGKTFELYQNRPNPFKKGTQINFYLPEASKTTLVLMDMTGRVVKTLKGNYEKGEHSIVLERGDIPGSGLFYYQLATSVGKMTKTMLIID